MAEIIVRPEKFTREWFEYIWDYYKYFIIAGIVVALVIVSAVVSFVTSVKYDANINFVITGFIENEKADIIETECAKNSNDLNGNNRVDIRVDQLNFTENLVTENAEMYTSLINKLIMLFSSPDEFIYVADTYTLDCIANIKNVDSVFMPSSEWADDDSLKQGKYAVSLKDSTLLKQLNIDSSDLYIMIADKSGNDEIKTAKENAVMIAKYLLK